MISGISSAQKWESVRTSLILCTNAYGERQHVPFLNINGSWLHLLVLCARKNCSITLAIEAIVHIQPLLICCFKFHNFFTLAFFALFMQLCRFCVDMIFMLRHSIQLL